MSDKYTFNLSIKVKLKVLELPMRTMVSYRQINFKDPESGGIIVGRVLEESDNIVIDEVSEPMKGDIQTRSRFSRRSDTHQLFYNERWKKSDGRCFYLGEWHTHPEKNPTPSIVDINNWRRIIRIDKQNISSLLFFIVGIDCVGIWQGSKNKSGQINIHYVGKIIASEWR